MYRQKFYNKGYKQKRKSPATTKVRRGQAFVREAMPEPINPFVRFRPSDLGAMDKPLEFLEASARQLQKLPRSTNRSYGRYNQGGAHLDEFRRLKGHDYRLLNRMLRTIAKRCPKMLNRDILTRLANLSVVRPFAHLEEWRPRYKSADKNWLDFAAYYVSGHDRPAAFFYTVLQSGTGRHRLVRRLASIARGESIYSIRSFFKAPLTKRMVRELFMDHQVYGHYAEAVRTAQLRALDAPTGIVRPIVTGPLGRGITSQAEEDFWWSVMQWMVNYLTEVGDTARVGPVLDYVGQCHQDDPNYSMKGRTRQSVLRAMEVWHRNLRASGDIHQMAYRSSGLKSVDYSKARDLSAAPEAKRSVQIEEVLSSTELLAEGQAQNHCVYSYHHNIVRGGTSIWSMKANGVRALTIEVTGGVIAQARGKFNRPPKSWEIEYLKRWAAGNGLSVRLI